MVVKGSSPDKDSPEHQQCMLGGYPEDKLRARMTNLMRDLRCSRQDSVMIGDGGGTSRSTGHGMGQSTDKN